MVDFVSNIRGLGDVLPPRGALENDNAAARVANAATSRSRHLSGCTIRTLRRRIGHRWRNSRPWRWSSGPPTLRGGDPASSSGRGGCTIPSACMPFLARHGLTSASGSGELASLSGGLARARPLLRPRRRGCFSFSARAVSPAHGAACCGHWGGVLRHTQKNTKSEKGLKPVLPAWRDKANLAMQIPTRPDSKCSPHLCFACSGGERPRNRCRKQFTPLLTQEPSPYSKSADFGRNRAKSK